LHKNIASQNYKGKYESRKILDFVKKIGKIDFFKKIEFSSLDYFSFLLF
jgi:hypothetical protein